MPNYSVRNCLNQNDIQVVFLSKGELTPGQVILGLDLGNQKPLGCYTVILETQDVQTIGYDGSYSTCLDCYQQNSFLLQFDNCKTISEPWYISSNDFQTLPTLNKIYYMSLDGGNNLCYQFVGLVESGPISTVTSDIVEYNQCEDCVVKPTFGELYSERVNDSNYTQKTNDFKNNYSNFINEREGQQPK